jgi:N-acetylmuramoyl-L-alanine amidase
MKRMGALVIVVGLLAVGVAQPQLLVNGVDVPGATTTLVPDVTYAPAADFARALGADVDVDLGGARVTLTLGAAIVQLALVTDAERVEAPSPAVVRDGRARPGPAALWLNGEAYLPVKAVGEALGGRVAFLTESASVAVVLPRPSLSMRREGFGVSERLVFALDAPGRYVTFQHAESGVLDLRFERADPLVTPALEGRSFVRAAVERVRGSSEARIQLAPGVEPRVWSVPAGNGMEVVVAFGAAGATQEPIATVARTRWVLDAGHLAQGGAAALAADVEGELTRAFVDLLAVELAQAGIDVERTRTGPAPVPLADRTAMGVGADAMVTVHLGDLPRRQARLYVLDDADAAGPLDRAIRWNAESALDRAGTDALRRSILLRLVTDLEVGRGWGTELARALGAAGWTVDGPVGAPLAVLAGAAGRGLFIEMSADDLRDPGAAGELARALVSAWSALGGR